MEKFLYYTRLFDCYKNLLNQNEQETFSAYYEENLTMQEIADNKKISRSAVGFSIKNTEAKLLHYEQALHLEAKLNKIDQLLLKLEDEELKSQLEKILK